jgi:hypothetical protein
VSRRAFRAFLACALTALLASVAAANASAVVWKFEHKVLAGSESIAGTAAESSLVFPGLKTVCDFSYGMTISNSNLKAMGKMGEVTISSCHPDSKACTVKSSTAQSLPWSAHGTTVSSTNYLVVEGIKFSILYAGAECALGEALVTFAGTAGGKYDNAAGTFTFDKASFLATGTAIEGLTEWNATFTTEALGPHKGQLLELG